MAKIKVYHFEVYDGAAGKMRAQPLKSPLARIEMVAGTIIEGTEEEVEDSDLDELGRYDPKKTR